MKCANIDCDNEAPHIVTYDLGNGMIGKAYYCIEHLSEGQKLNPFMSGLIIRIFSESGNVFSFPRVTKSLFKITFFEIRK